MSATFGLIESRPSWFSATPLLAQPHHQLIIICVHVCSSKSIHDVVIQPVRYMALRQATP